VADRTKTYSDDANIILDVPSLDIEVPDAALVTINGVPISGGGVVTARGRISQAGGVYSIDAGSVGLDSIVKNQAGDITVNFTPGFFANVPIPQFTVENFGFSGGLNAVVPQVVINETTVLKTRVNIVRTDTSDASDVLVALLLVATEGGPAV
jgi:hypothetical protein